MASLNSININTASSGTSWTNLVNLIYPVGSIYLGYDLMSSNDTSSSKHPANVFGGDWTPLAENRMLRGGWGNTAGGDDVHTHLSSLYYADLSAGLAYPDNGVSALIVSCNFPEEELNGNSQVSNGLKHGSWPRNTIVYRKNNEIAPWTNKGTYNEGSYYYSSDQVYSTTTYNCVSKNIPYKAFTKEEVSALTNDKFGYKYYFKNGDKSVQIPAYQTVNCWYRKS